MRRFTSLRQAAIPFFALLTAALVLFRTDLQQNLRGAAAVACVTALLSVMTIAASRPRRPVSLGSCYAALYGVFHTGLLISVAIAGAPQLLSPGDVHWLQQPGLGPPAVLAATGQATFTTAYLLRKAGAISANEQTGVALTTSGPARLARPWFAVPDATGTMGVLMLVAGVGLWCTNTVRSGATLVGGSYEEFLARTQATSMPTAYLMMGFGLGVLATSHRTRVRTVGLLVFAAFAVPGFLLGLRGEVIVPAACYLVVAARRRPIALRPWMALLPVAAMSAGSAVRVIRQTGLGASRETLESFNPLAGLAELGYSIRPLTYVSSVIDHQGQPTVGLTTYVAPFRRFVMGRVLGGHVTPAADDPAVFWAWINHEVGPIGGSPVAEAYRAGGTIGLILVMALIGTSLALVDGLRHAPLTDAAVGMLSFVFLLWVRNDFTPVPAEAALSLPVLGLLWLFSRRPPALISTAHAAAYVAVADRVSEPILAPRSR